MWRVRERGREPREHEWVKGWDKRREQHLHSTFCLAAARGGDRKAVTTSLSLSLFLSLSRSDTHGTHLWGGVRLRRRINTTHALFCWLGRALESCLLKTGPELHPSFRPRCSPFLQHGSSSPSRAWLQPRTDLISVIQLTSDPPTCTTLLPRHPDPLGIKSIDLLQPWTSSDAASRTVPSCPTFPMATWQTFRGLTRPLRHRRQRLPLPNRSHPQRQDRLSPQPKLRHHRRHPPALPQARNGAPARCRSSPSRPSPLPPPPLPSVAPLASSAPSAPSPMLSSRPPHLQQRLWSSRLRLPLCPRSSRSCWSSTSLSTSGKCPHDRLSCVQLTHWEFMQCVVHWPTVCEFLGRTTLLAWRVFGFWSAREQDVGVNYKFQILYFLY